MAEDEATRIRPASTVMLVRDAARGLEVFALRRVTSMPFAGGMTAFPGGGVDPSDSDPDVPWYGPDPQWWSRQWRLPLSAARAGVVAAVRELFEETGILLAGSAAEVVAGDPTNRESDRIAVTGHRFGLARVLAASGLLLRADLLRPWARWITPAGQSRRYDTLFFAAALPAGQAAGAVTTEASEARWAAPRDLLEAAGAGTIGMMPPTRAMLADLAAAGSVAELLATPRSVRPVTPVVVNRDGQVRVEVDGVDVGRPSGAAINEDGGR